MPLVVWERLHMDIWSPAGASSKGNVYVLAFVDTVSKYVVAVPIRNKTAKTVAKVFVEKVVAVYGPPQELYCDGAAEFSSSIVSELVEMFGVSRHITTPYHPQANGQIERVFATIRPMLATLVEAAPKRWDETLPFAIYAYNTSYHRSIRNTPFFLMYGRDPSLGSYGLEGVIGAPTHLENAKRLEILAVARRIALKHINEEAQKRKVSYDKGAKPQEFVVGDIVMLKSIRPPNIPAGKLYPWYVGPYRVVRVVGDAVLGVVPVGHPVKTVRHIHSNRARLSDGDCAPNPEMAELVSPFPALHDVDPNLEAESE